MRVVDCGLDLGRAVPASGQSMEELLVERRVLLLAAQRAEDVAADELVDHLASKP